MICIVCFDHLEHLVIDDARLGQALDEQVMLLLIHERAIFKRSHVLYHSELEDGCQVLPPTGGGVSSSCLKAGALIPHLW